MQIGVLPFGAVQPFAVSSSTYTQWICGAARWPGVKVMGGESPANVSFLTFPKPVRIAGAVMGLDRAA